MSPASRGLCTRQAEEWLCLAATSVVATLAPDVLHAGLRTGCTSCPPDGIRETKDRSLFAGPSREAAMLVLDVLHPWLLVDGAPAAPTITGEAEGRSVLAAGVATELVDHTPHAGLLVGSAPGSVPATFHAENRPGHASIRVVAKPVPHILHVWLLVIGASTARFWPIVAIFW